MTVLKVQVVFIEVLLMSMVENNNDNIIIKRVIIMIKSYNKYFSKI